MYRMMFDIQHDQELIQKALRVLLSVRTKAHAGVALKYLTLMEAKLKLKGSCTLLKGYRNDLRIRYSA